MGRRRIAMRPEDLPNDFEKILEGVMGGYGSGFWRDRSAGRCEAQHRIDLAYMRQRGFLASYTRGSLHWSRGGEPSGDIRFICSPETLRLIYRTRRYGEEEWTRVEEDIPFAWTRTAFDGRRRWLTCLSCGQRCRILYGGAYFRCRNCHGLTYESQYEQSWQRVITRAQGIRTKLGGSASMDEWFPPKPKGMHWRTYYRLEAEDEAADNYWAVAVMGKFGIGPG